ncbi:hypothetical protein ACFOG5_14355 [Pedobacter fastidiosus]|uniref:Uncharacterized protein n=1 Tax=Pedobacter fastidiosus TaxID=2765361 RepID=A0ABR7KY46_9SPHI|nr:hypothetical protein [Pedobacter fastidiosus]MBC6113051.1 hypothetical protein [Pedobacter fastidiosus]
MKKISLMLLCFGVFSANAKDGKPKTKQSKELLSCQQCATGTGVVKYFCDWTQTAYSISFQVTCCKSSTSGCADALQQAQQCAQSQTMGTSANILAGLKAGCVAPVTPPED